jgi:autotransporter-associated beta strand protein
MRTVALTSWQRRILWAGFFAAACLARMVSESPAATITPVINTLQSTLNVTMTFNGSTATTQTTGSLSDGYSGAITASLANNALTFAGGSSIVAEAASTGYQPPIGGANTEGSPQNYGGYFSSISVASFSFSSDADLRGLNFDITGGSAAIGAPANGLVFTIETGATNFSVTNLAAIGVPNGYYSENLGKSGTNVATNTSTSPVTVTVAGATETLTIPVNLTYIVTEENLPATLNFKGNLVSSAAISGGTWTNVGNGSWAIANNWVNDNNWLGTPVVPSSGTVAFAGANGPIAVTLDGNQSVGALVFDLAGSGYTLSQGTGGVLNLGTSAAGASISVLSGTQTISAPIMLAGSLTVNMASGGVLNLSGSIGQATPGLSLNLSGGGELILSGTDSFTGGTVVSSGTLLAASSTALATGTSLTIGTAASSLFAPASAGPSLVNLPATAVAAVPEPSTFALLGISAVGFAAYALRRRKAVGKIYS